MQPKVSVIIPVYNVEAYLEECLNSVTAQTFKDMEIILVNDGSTDRSVEIMQHFAEKDKRIMLHSQENKGVSVARNTGLRRAKGEYILFVDSDDKIVETAVQVLYQHAITTNADLVLGNASYWHPDGSIEPAFDRKEINNSFGLPGEICFERLMQRTVFPPLVYLFFVKRKLIIDNKLFFKKNIIHEDELWCVKTMFNSKQASLVDFDYYLYRQREGSIMNSNNHLFRIKSILTVSNELRKYASELKEKNIPESIIGYIYVRIFIQYHVIGTLLTKKDVRLLSKIRCYSELLRDIYSSLTYGQQKHCLLLYHHATQTLMDTIQMKPKVSVIVPVYNVEAYLEECLNSIISQKFTDMEIILVDDGSTDLSNSIMNEFAQKDSRIIIHSQTNQGVSAARNTGISLASGKYILFVDSDDTIVENAIEAIYNYATGTNADILIGNVLYCYPDGSKYAAFRRSQALNDIHRISGDSCFMRLMEEKAHPPLACLFFIRRELIITNEIYFKKEIIHEDELWCIQALFHAKHVSLFDFYYYMYRQREGSIMNSDNSSFRIESLLSIVSELDMLAKELYKKENISKGSIDYIYVRIFVIYYVIGNQLIKKEDKYALSIMRFFSELLIKIYPALMYNQQRACLSFYCKTSSVINKTLNK